MARALRICLSPALYGWSCRRTQLYPGFMQGLPAVKFAGGSPAELQEGRLTVPKSCPVWHQHFTYGSAPGYYLRTEEGRRKFIVNMMPRQSSAASKAPTPPTHCLVYSKQKIHPYPQWELRGQVLSSLRWPFKRREARNCRATQLCGCRAQADSQTASTCIRCPALGKETGTKAPQICTLSCLLTALLAA